MADRSAVSTILGYFYQFDCSILSILDLHEATDCVAIECIEDIDITTATETTAVQCKYYEKSEYNHSVIKPAVMFMLAHYMEGLRAGCPPIKYELRGYFSSGQSKLTVPFDIEFLKENFLTVKSKGVTSRKHEELSVSDLELQGFLDALAIDLYASRFADQFDAIIEALAKQFDCTPFTAEFFYYNNALRIIKELSIQADDTLRVVTKQEFLRRIDTSSILFDEWFIARQGKEQHYRKLRSEFFTSGLNVSPADRLFLIHTSDSSYERGAVKALLKTISRKYSKLSKREAKPFSPYVLILGIADAELSGIKQELYNEEFRFLDGHNFKGSKFDATSISRRAEHSSGPDLRIFSSLPEAQETFRSFKRSRDIFEFYGTLPVDDFGDSAIRHIKFQIPDYKDINHII